MRDPIVIKVVLLTIIMAIIFTIFLWKFLKDDNDGDDNDIGSEGKGGMLNVAVSGMNIACI